ncbi:MAG: SPOR domain-containing protein [Succinivibrio sp.]
MDTQPQNNTLGLKERLEKLKSRFLSGKSVIVCILVLLAVIIICYAATSGTNSQSMELNPQDSDSGSAEITFSNSAVAIDSDVDQQNSVVDALQNNEALTVMPTPSENESSEGAQPQTHSDSAMQYQERNVPVDADVQDSSAATYSSSDSSVSKTDAAKTVQLYCGKFNNLSDANAKKANIAFSTGLISNIVRRNNVYQLFLGKFKSREEAVSTFNRLDSSDLVDECELEFSH